jgi:phage shock protein PspC (stress-responsive transcriptional regulator)
MNKTIIININGIVFHIEEDAYEILKNYMTDVKRHFLNSADSLEITTDIENRVAEMFSEILATENKQVIVEQDVNSVIEQMGRVEDFEDVYEDNKNPSGGAEPYTISSRKLFRDPDDHLVSGVCAGVANYFDIEPVWVRSAFAISIFFAGSGLLLYIVFWILIPKATTRADRMAMKGEKLNLQGFKNNLEEELSSVKNHLNNFQDEARPFVYKMRDFISDFFHHLGIFFGGAGKILVKLIGIVALLACFAGAIALVVMLIATVGFNADGPRGIFPFTIIANQHANYIYVSAFLTAFIPVLTLILVIIAAVFDTRSIGRSAGTTLLFIWLFALGFFVYFAAMAASNFKDRESISETVTLKATPDKVYYLKLNDVKYLTQEDSVRLNIKGSFHNMIIKNDDYRDNEPRNVTINFEKSDVPQPEIIETFSAQGRDYQDALLNARNTSYKITQKDSILTFDSRLRRLQGEAWHDEQVEITVKVPLNAKMIVDQELADRVNMQGIDVNDCKNTDKHPNAPSAAFVMTDDGLQCKIDTVVILQTPKQIDSIRRANNLRVIERLKAQLDSTKLADSIENSQH